jgi:hypothetical protein
MISFSIQSENKNMKSKQILVALLIIFFVFFGIYKLNPPSTIATNADLRQFSAGRATEHLEIIAQKPHPIGSPENAKVRNYIVKTLSALGMSSQIQETTVANQRWGYPLASGTVHNIITKLPGTNNTKAILIAAHHDSVINSPGASDDGAAVAAMLETIRALKSNSPLKNDVIFLFTDGEEVGLIGAKAFVDEHPWAKDVGLVLNFEARGNSGPSIMFETSDENGWVIPEFAKAATHPVANSLTQSVYKILQNDTDMSMFKQAGLTGLNFAYMNGVIYYHTADDNLKTIDKRSLQHHGEYALALARHFGNLNLDKTRKSDAVYFDIFGSVLVHYPQAWVLPLTVLVVVLFVWLVIFGLRTKILTFPGIFIGFFTFLGSAISTALLVTVIWQIILNVNSEYQWLVQGDTYNSNFYVIAFIALNIAITSSIYGLVYKKVSLHNLITGALLWWLIFMVLTSLYLPGASYLFTWPLLFTLIGLGFIFKEKNHKHVFWQNLILFTVFTLPGIILFVPTIYLVFHALTISKSGILMILVVLLLGLLIPHLYFISNIKRWLVPTTALFISLAFIATGSLTAGFTANHPQPNSIFYAVNADTGKAIWASTDQKTDKWTSQFLTGKITKGALPEYLPMAKRVFLASNATPLPLIAPSVKLLDNQVKDNVRFLRLQIPASPETRVMRVYLDPKVQVLQATLNGKQINNNQTSNNNQLINAWGLHYFAPPKTGIELTLAVKSTQSIKIQVVNQSDGLPKIPGQSFTTRPDYMMPTAFGYGVGDSTLVSKSFTF